MVPLARDNSSIDLYSSSNVSIAVDNNVSTATRQNPLPQSHTPFTSSLNTLSESIRDPTQGFITQYDLIEAYNVISLRLRTLMQKDKAKFEQSSLGVLRLHSDCIEQCLSRDIRRLLPNPFDTQTSFPQSYLSQDNLEDDIQRATNNVLLCCYALRLVADIFAFPVVHVNFTVNQLSSLIEDVVSICSTPAPLPNMKKLCAMIMLMLKSQQLPASVLYPVRATITPALKSAICDRSGGLLGQQDAFQAIHHILSRDPTFFNSFLQILPHIFENLNLQPIKAKPMPALALCGFATAKMKLLGSNISFNGEKAFEMTNAYLNEQGSRRPSLKKENLLPALFKDAFTSNEHSWKVFGPAFGIVVAASLIVLLDHALFTSSRAIKLIFEVIGHTADHKKNVRALHPELWSMLIWAFSRLLPRAVLDGNSQDDADDSRSELMIMRERAFEVVVQDLRHGTGLALVGTLLNKNKDVGKALDVVARLIATNDRAMVDEGIRTMDRLVSHIGAGSSPRTPTRKQMDGDSLPFSLGLIDGSILFQGTSKLGLPSPARTALEQIAPLTEEEVTNHWSRLSEAWISVVQSFLARNREISPELLRIWQALLLVRSDLTQHQHHHLTAPAAFGIQIAEIINGFAVPPVTDPPISGPQIGYLTFVRSLWGVVRNVFTEEWLVGPAEAILAPLLKAKFDLIDDNVKAAWSQLCAELTAVSMPTILHVVHRARASKEDQDREVTRYMWNLSAKNILRDPAKEDWQGVVKFLEIPLGIWDLSDDEFTLWEDTFRAIVTLSTEMDPGIHPVSVFMNDLVESKPGLLQALPKLIWSLLSMSFQRSPPLMNKTLLSLANDIMLSQYPREKATKPEAIPVDALHAIGQLITRLTESDILQFLAIMEPSLSCWIVDEMDVLHVEQHERIVHDLYKPSLDLLSRLPPTLSTLKQTANFLTSVFVKVSSDGPLAFHSFWRSTYHLCDAIPKREYPDIIKVCLKAWSDLCEDSIGDGFSLGSEEDCSVVSDSQPDYAEEDPLDRITRKWMEERESSKPEEEMEEDEVEADVTIQTRDSNFLPNFATSPPRTIPHQLRDEQSQSKHKALQSMRFNYPTTPPAPAFRLRTPIEVELRPTVASSSKRTLEDDIKGSHNATKRRRIPVPFIDSVTKPKPRAGKGRAREDLIYSKTAAADVFSSSLPLPGITVSEPPGRASRSSLDWMPSPGFSSQPKKTPNKTDNSWLHADFSRLSRPGREQVRATRVQGYMSALSSPPVMTSDLDYDSWERGVSPHQLMEVLGEQEENPLQFEDHEGSDVNDEFLEAEAQEATNEVGDTDHASDDDILSPSLSEYPLSSRRRDRSQTAPEPDIEKNFERSTPMGQPLRRHHTSPGPGAVGPPEAAETGEGDGATPVAPSIAALQQAYARFAEAGVSGSQADEDSLDIEELVLARKIANQINQVLDEKMASKIASRIKK